MKKVLYHGSEFLIEKPEFGKGARHNDYGRGFYCTENIELAIGHGRIKSIESE